MYMCVYIYIYTYIHTYINTYMYYTRHTHYTARSYLNNRISCCMCFTDFIQGKTIVPLYIRWIINCLVWNFERRCHFYLFQHFLPCFIHFPPSFIPFQPVWGWFMLIRFFHHFQSFSTHAQQHLLVTEKRGSAKHWTARRSLEVLISGPAMF